MKPFIFFDLGQTLIDEWDYINNFDKMLLETLNGYGAKIDYRNYLTLRNNILRNRKIGSSGLLNIVFLMAQLILPKGYDLIIFNKLKDNLLENKKKLIKLYDDVPSIIPLLSKTYSLGIISNNSSGSVGLLVKNNLIQYFETICLSQNIGVKKPDPIIFNKAIEDSCIPKENCVMIGDRLDIDIYPANDLGIKTIRTLNSIYKVQNPTSKKEEPLYVINSLNELPKILSSIF
ncbi:MAG: HAD family hydrolase [Thermoproteota archaeon]|nr:HAD family hydrolase [Thermoproteota archaeon]